MINTRFKEISMNHFFKIIMIGLALGACDTSKGPTYETELANADIAYKGNLEPSKCLPGKNFIVEKNSTATWRATKFKSSDQKDILMVGTNGIVGNLNIPGTWENAVANFDFEASTTNSEDPLRDSRITSFVFGLPDSIPFGFRLTKLVGDNYDVKDNESRTFTASGTLFVGNTTTDIELPVLVKDYLGLITITPAEVFKLNVRSTAPGVNAVNLSDRIRTLLTFVPGVDMRPDVYIDFNIGLTPACI